MLVIILPLLVSPISCWGFQAHQIIGNVASSFLSPEARAQILKILGPNSIAAVSNWADSSPAFYSTYYNIGQKSHYMEIPISQCEKENNDVDWSGKELSLVGAITKFSNDASCNSTIPPKQKRQALMFLIHYVGETTQPLHVSGRDRGGNDVRVRFGTFKNESLHRIWDNLIVKQRISEIDSKNAQSDYTMKLVSRIRSNGAPASWKSSFAYTDVNSRGHSKAAIEWTNQSNRIACSHIWKAFDADPKQDFGGVYYKDVSNQVDTELAKGGYRLALMLNEIYSSC